MLLIVEIILTVAAWRRGWRARALLPIAVCLLLAFVFGAVIGASGGSMDSVVGVAFLLDLTAIVTLAVMVARPRTAEPEEQATGTAIELESVPQTVAQQSSVSPSPADGRLSEYFRN
jgi:uncharacterized membrane protein YfcA